MSHVQSLESSVCFPMTRTKVGPPLQLQLFLFNISHNPPEFNIGGLYTLDMHTFMTVRLLKFSRSPLSPLFAKEKMRMSFIEKGKKGILSNTSEKNSGLSENLILIIFTPKARHIKRNNAQCNTNCHSTNILRNYQQKIMRKAFILWTNTSETPGS